jgi:hypothetical protein
MPPPPQFMYSAD